MPCQAKDMSVLEKLFLWLNVRNRIGEKIILLEKKNILSGKKNGNVPNSTCSESSRRVWSTVRLRFRKSISENHFQTIKKISYDDFQYHREVIFNTKQCILTKKCVFPHVRKFTLIYGPYSCIINILFIPILMYLKKEFNARFILELMLCNSNLPKLYILTLLSSDCRAWAL